MQQAPFHLAFPVAELPATRTFFVDVLGCSIGRESDIWIDFNFFGNQITAHLDPNMNSQPAHANEVDRKMVPVPHFGAILEWDHFHQLADRLQAAKVPFIHEPMIRFKGEIGEQATMFVKDPSGNAMEFKSFKDPSRVFAS